MRQALLEFTANVLDPIGVWIGLILAVPVFWTWIDLSLLRGRRHRHWLEQVRREPGRRPAILIVDLKAGADIRTQVENFRMGDPQLREIPEAHVGRVFRDKPLAIEDLADLLGEVRNHAADFMRQGVDTIHLFYAGPLAPMAMIGAQFANGFKVLVYQHRPGSGGVYDNWGPLQQP